MMCIVKQKEIEYKGFKVLIFKKDYNPNVICTTVRKEFEELYYFYTKFICDTQLSIDEIIVRQEIIFKDAIDYFYTDIESVNKENLCELLNKYAVVHVPDYDASWSFIDEHIFKIIMNQYNKNYGID